VCVLGQAIADLCSSHSTEKYLVSLLASVSGLLNSNHLKTRLFWLGDNWQKGQTAGAAHGGSRSSVNPKTLNIKIFQFRN